MFNAYPHRICLPLYPPWHAQVLINELVAQPLVLRVSQCEPKSNARTVLASGELFLDHLLSHRRIETYVPLVPAVPPSKPVEVLEGEEPPPGPMLLVAIEISQPLVDPEELDEEEGGLRILDLKLDRLRSLPASWLVAEGQPASEHPYSYTAVAAIPLGNGDEYLVTFHDGALVVPQPPGMGAPATDGAPAADSPAPPPPPAGDAADVPDTGGQAVEQTIEWPAAPSAPTRCILPAASAQHVKEMLDSGAPLRITLSRSLNRPELTEPEANRAKWAAVCEAHLGALVQLDALSATAHCALQPEFPPDEEAAAAAAAAPPNDEKKGKGKEKKEAQPAAKPKGGKGKEPPKRELPAEPVEFPHPYTAFSTTLILTATTDRPLFPRPPPPPPPVPTVAQLIPRRVLPSLLPKSANAEFEAQVRAAVQSLLDEFAQLFGKAPLEDDSAEARETRRRQLLYELNNSGVYFGLKERLKKAVVRIVRESFHRTEEEELQPSAQTDRFYSELYVHLVKLAHSTLHAVFYPPAAEGDAATAAGRAAVSAAMGGLAGGGRLRAAVVPTSEPRLAQLRRLADEMETELRWEACAALHEERLCLAESDGGLWKEYGLMLLRAGQGARAEAALREAISLLPKDALAITAYGSLLFGRDKVDEAEVGAQRLRAAAARPAVSRPAPASSPAPSFCPIATPACAPAAARSRERRPRHAARRRSAAAQSYFKEVTDLEPESALAWAGLALVYSVQGREREAKRTLKRASALSAQPELLNVELAESLVPLCAQRMAEAALGLHAQLLATQAAKAEAGKDEAGEEGAGEEGEPPQPPAESERVRICRARCLLSAQRYDDACALYAQLLDQLPARADLHTELGHAHFCAGRNAQALEAYSAALARAPDTHDASLLLRTAQLTLAAADASHAGPAQHALWARARDAALRACKFAPSASTWLAVGVACAALSSASEAEEALSEACVLNNRNEKVWAHLCLLTLKQGRKDEAAHVRQLAPLARRAARRAAARPPGCWCADASPCPRLPLLPCVPRATSLWSRRSASASRMRRCCSGSAARSCRRVTGTPPRTCCAAQWLRVAGARRRGCSQMLWLSAARSPKPSHSTRRPEHMLSSSRSSGISLQSLPHSTSSPAAKPPEQA